MNDLLTEYVPSIQVQIFTVDTARVTSQFSEIFLLGALICRPKFREKLIQEFRSNARRVPNATFQSTSMFLRTTGHELQYVTVYFLN